MSIQLDTISYVATIVGVISISSTLFTLFREKIKQNAQSSSLKEDTFSTLLDSSDIDVLGKYLDNDIGKLYISDYVDNSELNRKVDLFLNKLTHYVGTEDEIKSQSKRDKVDEPEIKVVSSIKGDEDLSSEFRKIIHELYQGETWNALAKLRRHLEIKIKEIGKRHGVEKHDALPLTILIDHLKHLGIIDTISARDIKSPIRVCNKAIHGEPIELKEAEEAIYLAAKIMKDIDNNTPNMH